MLAEVSQSRRVMEGVPPTFELLPGAGVFGALLVGHRGRVVGVLEDCQIRFCACVWSARYVSCAMARRTARRRLNSWTVASPPFSLSLVSRRRYVQVAAPRRGDTSRSCRGCEWLKAVRRQVFVVWNVAGDKGLIEQAVSRVAWLMVLLEGFAGRAQRAPRPALGLLACEGGG